MFSPMLWLVSGVRSGFPTYLKAGLLTFGIGWSCCKAWLLHIVFITGSYVHIVGKFIFKIYIGYQIVEFPIDRVTDQGSFRSQAYSPSNCICCPASPSENSVLHANTWPHFQFGCIKSCSYRKYSDYRCVDRHFPDQLPVCLHSYQFD